MMKEKIQKLLQLMESNAQLTSNTLAEMLDESVETIQATIQDLEKQGVIAGYHTMVNWDATEDEKVSAMIEVNVNLTHGVGYTEIAQILYQFKEVESLYLMSGTYDFMLLTKRQSMINISKFVSRLASIDEVVSTTTHIVMNRHKDHGVIYDDQDDAMERLVVTQ